LKQDKLTPRWLVLTLIATALTLAAVYASHQGMANQLFAVLTLCIVNACLMVWVARDKSFAALSLWHVLVTTSLLAFTALFVQPLLEDDHFRYLWDGYITATTAQPYAWAPSLYFGNDAVPLRMQAVLSGINNPEVPTIYGPILQVLFGLCYWLSPAALWPFKLLLLCALLLVLLLLHRAAIAPRWLLLFALHPVVFKESTLTAHPDLLIGAALLAAVLAWQRGLQGWAAGLASIAVAIKFSSITVLPFFCINRQGRFSWRGCSASVLTLCLVYAPVGWSVAGGEGRALAVLGEQWTFNPLLFRLASTWLSDSLARVVVLVLFVVVLMGIFFRWVQQLQTLDRSHFTCPADSLPLPPVVAVFTALLLLSPVVNPWYWLWILPLAALRFSWVAWVVATVSLLAYAHVAESVWHGSSIVSFAVPLWATLTQILMILGGLEFAYLAKIRHKL
jgi:hypothetical protein